MPAAYITWTTGQKTKSLRFDAVLSETHQLTAAVTDHPVERGANVADHVRAEPDKLTLDVLVTQHPTDPAALWMDQPSRGDIYPIQLDEIRYQAPPAPTPGYLFNGVGAALTGAFKDVTDPPVAQVLRFTNAFDAVSEIFAVLRQLRDEGTLVSVISSVWDYENMVITNLDIPFDSPSQKMAATIEFRQIRIVESRQTSEPVPTETRGKRPKDSGAKSGKDDKSKPKASIAYGVLSKVFGGL